ncbi:Glutathione S-transferase 2 [Teratosphaeriaceae sp. CCFEE 6253]|nr:Glutathione S-transferase 2 [Teratosphaeriaceae sp. CCFEE 6253]
MSSEKSELHLYTTATPNGIKISITLEELGVPYDWTKIEFSKSTQKEPWFLEINPNGRIPALTDKFTDGKLIRLFESGSIMQYLVDNHDPDHKISFPHGTREQIEGQANHFTRYAPEHIEYGVNRYQNETRRLYGVLDKHLTDTNSDWLVGGKCTIADIAHWGWVSAAGWAGVEIKDFPALHAWEERMWSRPAVQKGANIPDPYKMKELLADKEKQGMKEDAEKNKERSST